MGTAIRWHLVSIGSETGKERGKAEYREKSVLRTAGFSKSKDKHFITVVE